MTQLTLNDVAEENAVILIEEVRRALARGTRHYNQAGEHLTTSKAIVECLLAEGCVTFVDAGTEEKP